MPKKITVEVVWALEDRQDLNRLEVTDGISVQELWLSLDKKSWPSDFGDNPPLGIFGKKVSPDTVLLDGDRLEIYRPLLVDPKENRRLRALKKQKKDKINE